MNSIPDWLLQDESYTATSDNDGFITRSLLSVMGALASFRAKSSSYGAKFPAHLKLLLCLALILTTSLARNMIIVYAILAVLLIHMCFLKSDWLIRAFTASITAALLSALILLPSVFLGSPRSMLTVSIKVFTSVGLVGLLAATTEWNRLTACLASFHVPGIFIFTLDITLKYIVILGNISVDLLSAVRLRSVGRNRDKKSAVSGVLGVTFLKSRAMAEEMYQAMVCRGFDGEYGAIASSRSAESRPEPEGESSEEDGESGGAA